MLEMVSRVKKDFGSKIDVIGGNLATRSAAKAMIEAGADAIKVGIGAGSICTTRVAGVGAPQITAIMEAATVASAGPACRIIADGGMRIIPATLPRLWLLGADSVMLGSMFLAR